MNKVILVGRLTKDPNYGNSQSGKSYAKFSVAVDRPFKQGESDFINCIAFEKTADFINKYFKKGNRIALEGRIQTGSYKNRDGQTVYTTEVFVERVEFVETKTNARATQDGQTNPQATQDGFVDDLADDGLPFN